MKVEDKKFKSVVSQAPGIWKLKEQLETTEITNWRDFKRF